MKNEKKEQELIDTIRNCKDTAKALQIAVEMLINCIQAGGKNNDK